MFSFHIRSFTFLFLFGIQTLSNAQFGQIPPFSISLQAVSGTNLPGLHSFAHARSGDKWLFIGGRTNGLHGLNSSGAFPPEYKNENVIVIDTGTWSYYSATLNQLPLHIADPMRSTNMQYVHSGDYLYMTGGYGYDSLASMFVTFPVLTAVHVDSVINAVINSLPLAPFIRQVVDTNMAVCGGEMGKIGSDYYLCFGHNFGGHYTDPPTPLFTQVYSNKITRFSISDDGTAISLSGFSYDVDTTHFHRRDLNMGPVIHPDGSPGLAAFGGVFQKTENLPYLEPVSIRPSGALVDTAYQQKMSQYTCALMPIYDSLSQKMYTTFFGGISLYDYDPLTGLVNPDSLCPFISDITTLTMHADGSAEETVLPVQLPGLLGSNAKFIPSGDIPLFSNEVINIRALPNTPVLAGYIFGGIRAEQGNFGSSAANDTVYRVYLNPNNTSGIREHPENTGNALIYPNPSSGNTELFFHLAMEEMVRISIEDITGKTIFSQTAEQLSRGNHSISLHTENLGAGLYFCRFSTGKTSQVLRFILLR